MDDDDDIEVPGLGRRKSKVASSGGGGGMGAGAVVGLSLVTSVLASAGTVVGLSKSGMLAPAAPVAVHGDVAGTGAGASAPSAAPSASPSPSGSASASASASAGDVRVPDLVRVPVANARSVADALGLRINERERRADPVVPADAVAAQSPLPGSSVHRGDAIDVFISSGPAPGASAAPVASAAPSAAPTAAPGASASAALDPANTVEVPRFVGQRIQRARPAVTAAGLVLGSQREIFDEDHGPHAVLRQSIPAGTRVPRGTSIDLVYNQGE